jgi:hypothetical protein
MIDILFLWVWMIGRRFEGTNALDTMPLTLTMDRSMYRTFWHFALAHPGAASLNTSGLVTLGFNGRDMITVKLNTLEIDLGDPLMALAFFNENDVGRYHKDLSNIMQCSRQPGYDKVKGVLRPYIGFVDGSAVISMRTANDSQLEALRIARDNHITYGMAAPPVITIDENILKNLGM